MIRQSCVRFLADTWTAPSIGRAEEVMLGVYFRACQSHGRSMGFSFKLAYVQGLRACLLGFRANKAFCTSEVAGAYVVGGKIKKGVALLQT